MKTSRLEAFSDGVLAIIITIMVLELKVPHGTEWADLRPLIPVFLTYVLSFIYLGIYWNNHHHMMAVTERINGRILWANLHLLFWLSLIPATTGWMGENDFAELPTMLYGIDLLLAAIAYYILQSAIVREQGPNSTIAAAIGRDIKGKLSPVLYVAGISFALLNRWVAIGVYVAVALMWLIPDRRIESVVEVAPNQE
ncbi:MAG: DUF1211 domain-containing protein [Actinobacteria bacterium]|nr:DUF1211 domain-containing protein [Actinomycetota bacterium]